MKHFDILVSDLCEEIDYLKEQVSYWKERYEQERTENTQILQERMHDAQKGVANVLRLALSVRDNEDGSLSISKEDRHLLAEQYKD